MTQTWQSLWLSLQIALAATALTCAVGVPLAYLMARSNFRGRGFIDALILLPLVLPPTVVGYLILVSVGSRGWVGAWLKERFDYSIVFRFEGAVIAAAVVALPMLYMPAKAAFQDVDREMEDIAKTMGANRLQMFWHVSLPLARRGIFSGLVLAFARALGEFGATVMVYGWQPDRLTLPISIYRVFETGEDMLAALPAVTALLVTSLALIMVYNRWSRPQK